MGTPAGKQSFEAYYEGWKKVYASSSPGQRQLLEKALEERKAAHASGHAGPGSKKSMVKNGRYTKSFAKATKKAGVTLSNGNSNKGGGGGWQKGPRGGTYKMVGGKKVYK